MSVIFRRKSVHWLFLEFSWFVSVPPRQCRGDDIKQTTLSFASVLRIFLDLYLAFTLCTDNEFKQQKDHNSDVVGSTVLDLLHSLRSQIAIKLNLLHLCWLQNNGMRKTNFESEVTIFTIFIDYVKKLGIKYTYTSLKRVSWRRVRN